MHSELKLRPNYANKLSNAIEDAFQFGKCLIFLRQYLFMVQTVFHAILHCTLFRGCVIKKDSTIRHNALKKNEEKKQLCFIIHCPLFTYVLQFSTQKICNSSMKLNFSLLFTEKDNNRNCNMKQKGLQSDV